ncbi:MAG: ABC transporter ATP-binding protein [Actinobacteria bacterium]|nr:ABC transporter ATP-binding protein [Actinomycetota bacterium]
MEGRPPGTGTNGGAIAAERLTKSYGRSRGIVDVTFEVLPGEIFGFLGPNGAGKTTTIRTILDLIRPTSGRAAVLGLDSHEHAIEIRRRTGYLPGEFAAYENMNGRDYLGYFAHLRGGVDPERVRLLAERLQSDLDVRISSLSHGNRQKLGLIQAFMHRPSVLVLDEPTQGLDPIMQQEFHRLIFEAREAGTTVFISSHVLPEIERLCDRVGVIREGRLISVEDVGTLKARALRTIELQFDGPAPRGEFEGLPGVRDVEVHGDSLRFTVAGDLDRIVKTAARHRVVDLVSHEPGLEEIFLAFYGPDGGAPEGAPEEEGKAAP